MKFWWKHEKEMETGLIIIILSILFVSTLTRSTFGFGDALIAMPLLSMFISIKIATPLVALIACIISTLILLKNWRKVRAEGFIPLIIFSVIGIPIGLIWLKGAAEPVVKVVLGIILIAFGFYKLINPALLQIKRDRFAFLFGLIAGMLGGAYNTNGPPIIIYGTMRRWPQERFRAILQGIFLPTNIFIMIGHGIGGLWTTEVWTMFLTALPVVFLAIWLGSRLNKIIPAQDFLKYIHSFLILIGLVLIIKTVV